MWVKAYLLSYKQLMFALDEVRYGKTLSILGHLASMNARKP